MKKKNKKIYIMILTVMLLASAVTVWSLNRTPQNHTSKTDVFQNLSYVRNEYNNNQYFKQYSNNDEIIIYNPLIDRNGNQ